MLMLSTHILLLLINLINLIIWYFVFYRVIAIFGSSTPEIDRSVSSVCSSLHIPHLTTTMQKFENEVKSKTSLDRKSGGDYSIYLGPSQHDLVTMTASVVNKLGWHNLALITHRETGKMNVSHVDRSMCWITDEISKAIKKFFSSRT